MLVIHTIVQFNRPLKAKLQRRDRKGRFAKPLPNPSDVENNPLVSFYYPMSETPWNSKLRYVRVISSTPSHIIGLEKQENGKWKFKKFLQSRATGFRMQEFNPKAMS